ncbi:hypothetical protein U732_3903 [Clostridium argentinense CDC 2741]|uniref:Uncharacterized protein n=1 Tax=Clostridium argentinense CDC 2741 TaxID=1418104 RepID=A0A0C1U8I6_9CLOT|nr:DUF3006 domain-containing protein [Clostridium argentinense]ARC85095.1 pyruvate kinase [Clostridium argentinense]KIE48013.1 hypothetical protein U732_3903 [Clostridium argentinense CDC 2741]NFF39609.1 DUF3006 domain-containing protein [Clostridium argentinense]NFP51286.1 DUF3006 domain-containing protein [Clostridium argentinense]NFP72796.1 DUF3006 domain-containing protein [Clostridium argentinense]
MKFIIDRFEEKFAVCENEKGIMVNIPRDTLPKEAKEGDVLIIEEENIYIDVEETEKLRKEIEELVKDLWEE